MHALVNIYVTSYLGYRIYHIIFHSMYSIFHMSEIWSFFSISKQDSSRALCSECDANISRGKNSKTYSTSPLWNHLKNSHPELFKRTNKSKSSLPTCRLQPEQLCNNAPNVIESTIPSIPLIAHSQI